MTHLPPEPTMPAREPHFLLILRAALTLPATFTKADLVEASWIAHPHEFGMRTYNYPNSQAVYCKIDGATGLVGRGYLEWVSAGVLRVTEAGRKFAAKPITMEPRPTYADLRVALTESVEALRTICAQGTGGGAGIGARVAIENAQDILRRSR